MNYLLNLVLIIKMSNPRRRGGDFEIAAASRCYNIYIETYILYGQNKTTNILKRTCNYV